EPGGPNRRNPDQQHAGRLVTPLDTRWREDLVPEAGGEPAAGTRTADLGDELGEESGRHRADRLQAHEPTGCPHVPDLGRDQGQVRRKARSGRRGELKPSDGPASQNVNLMPNWPVRGTAPARSAV